MEGNNQEKQTVVKVKDIVAYLQKLNPEMEVGLDKDGWMGDIIPHTDAVDLVEKNGLFDVWEHKDKTLLWSR